jgi:isopropylmalate/homocitrate/citramalate synthase
MEEKYTEEYFRRLEKRVNKFLSNFKPIKDENFIGYKAIVGKEKYHNGPTIKITALFKEPFKGEHSDIANTQTKKIIPMLKDSIPHLENAIIKGGSSSTIKNYEEHLDLELQWLGRKLDESTLPFKQTIKDGVKTRVFDKNIDDHELQWHRDERDRIVEVVKGSGWKFQMDDELPRTLKEGDRFTIPSEIYHRVIRGNGDLVIKIKEL